MLRHNKPFGENCRHVYSAGPLGESTPYISLTDVSYFLLQVER